MILVGSFIDQYKYAITYNRMKIIKYFTTFINYLPPLSIIIKWINKYNLNDGKELAAQFCIKKYQISNSKHKLIYIYFVYN